MPSKRSALHTLFLVAIACMVSLNAAYGQALPVPTAEKLPRYRGFNLLEKFHLDWSNGPYQESDFRMISEFGFNFVRLPMDYRVWIKNQNWNQFDERVLAEIDQAVEWGKQYSIHVCLNFHRAPGYTVASPPEETNLWTNEETQEVCAKHWATFAKRYRNVPNSNLSFNLFNEPYGVDESTYVKVVEKMVAAIRAEDPKRLIISDGMEYGGKPVFSLKELGIAQATRGYTPIEITHYRAKWMPGANEFPAPAWPQLIASGLLFAPTKSEIPEANRSPLTIHSQWNADTPLRFRVATVSSNTTLVVRADDEVIWSRAFAPTQGKGEWRSSTYYPEWDTVQAVYNRNYETTIPAGTRVVEFAVVRGDWLSISQLSLTTQSQGIRPVTTKLDLADDWESAPAQLQLIVRPSRVYFSGLRQKDRQWLWDETMTQWVQAQDSGIGVMVGEFGCHNQTPHDVTLAWMKDCLENWKRAGIGWALWNFRGGFGVMDSDRSDVVYERYQGHRLDRKMLNLLKEY